MAFKPKNSGKEPSGDFEPRNLPTPKDGNRPARLSLIIDLGTQDREDFEETDGTKKPQKPCQQIVVFADLVKDVVDYGGKIGKQQYRMLLNKSFQGVPVGINFTTTPPKDAKGNLIQGKPWGLHPANLLTKVAKAVGKEEIIYDDRKNPNSLDIEQLLNEPFMINVEVKKTPALDKQTGEAKKDKEGKPIVYTNVNFKGATPLPMVAVLDAEGEDTGEEKLMKVPALTQPARCVTFESATVDDIQYIRPSIIKIIKQANDYAGSQMQAAIEAFEAKAAGNDDNDDEGEEAAAPAPAPAPATTKRKPAAAPKPQPKAVVGDDMDDDIPF
jgi:hypothetical protein